MITRFNKLFYKYLNENKVLPTEQELHDIALDIFSNGDELWDDYFNDYWPGYMNNLTHSEQSSVINTVRWMLHDMGAEKYGDRNPWDMNRELDEATKKYIVNLNGTEDGTKKDFSFSVSAQDHSSAMVAARKQLDALKSTNQIPRDAKIVTLEDDK